VAQALLPAASRLISTLLEPPEFERRQEWQRHIDFSLASYGKAYTGCTPLSTETVLHDFFTTFI
jgi:hypothetical protein